MSPALTTPAPDTSTLTRFLSGLPNLTDPADALGMCVIDALKVAPRLGKHNVPHVFVRLTGTTYRGKEHWAIAVLPDHAPDDLADVELSDATMIDRTAHQFNPALPYPHITGWDTWLDDLVEAMNDGVFIEVTTDPAVDVYSLWDRYERDDIDPFKTRNPTNAR